MAGAGYKLFNTGDVLTAAQVNTYLQEQTVMVFASSTARTTALSGVLAEGMMSYLQDTNSVEVYNGTSWVNVGNAGDITEVQAGVGISIASGTGPIPVITNSSTDLITTAGDLLYGTAADTVARLGIGTAGQVLKVNSGATAPVWAVDPTTDVVTTAGDLIYATGADAVTRLGIGTAGQVLKVNSGATAPEWGAAGGGVTYAGCFVYSSVDLNISNNTMTAINYDSENYDTDGFHSTSTNTNRVTIPTGKGGYYRVYAALQFDSNATGVREIYVRKNGTNQFYNSMKSYGTANRNLITITGTVSCSAGDYIDISAFQDSGVTLSVGGGNSPYIRGYLGVDYLGA